MVNKKTTRNLAVGLIVATAAGGGLFYLYEKGYLTSAVVGGGPPPPPPPPVISLAASPQSLPGSGGSLALKATTTNEPLGTVIYFYEVNGLSPTEATLVGSVPTALDGTATYTMVIAPNSRSSELTMYFQASDSATNAGTDSQVVQVTQAGNVLFLTPATGNANIGEPVTFTVQGPPNDGLSIYKDGKLSTKTVTLDASGSATFNESWPGAGQHSVYVKDASGNQSAPSVINVVVPTINSITMTSDVTSVPSAGGDVNLTAVISPVQAGVNVWFYEQGTTGNVANTTTDSTGTARAKVTIPPNASTTASQSFVFDASGNDKNTYANSNLVTVTEPPASPFQGPLTLSDGGITTTTINTTVDFKLKGNVGDTVTIYRDGNVFLSNVVIPSTGVYDFTTSWKVAGTKSVYAQDSFGDVSNKITIAVT